MFYTYRLATKKTFLRRCLILLILIPLGVAGQYLDTSKKYMNDNRLKSIAMETKEKNNIRYEEYERALNSLVCPYEDTTTLLYLKNGNKSILRTKEFNDNVKMALLSIWNLYLSFTTDSIPNVSIEDIRNNITYNCLEEAYLKKKWEEAKQEKLFNDSLTNEITRFNNVAKNNIPDSIFKIRYEQYYDELFSGKNKSLYAVISSTDSSLLDSLSKKIGIKLDSKQKQFVLKDSYSVDIYEYDILTLDIKHVIHNLKGKRWSKIIKTKWGFIIVGEYKYKIEKDKKFEEAIDDLIYLPIIKKDKTSVSEDSAFKFFENNKEFFQPEDTLLLSLSILPNVYKKLNKNEELPVVPVDFHIDPIKCYSTDLPKNVCKELLNSFSFYDDSCSNWVNLDYGRWKVCILNIIPAKKIYYEGCRSEVKKYLQSIRRTEFICEAVKRKKQKMEFRSYNLFKNKIFYAKSPSEFSNKKKETRKKVLEWAFSEVISFISINSLKN
jgi:hypothetical protein